MASQVFTRGVLTAALATAALVAGCNRAEPPLLPVGVTVAVSPLEQKPVAPSATVPFFDRAASLGVEFTYHNGSEANLATILESVGGGLGWLDFDRDGWPDLVVSGGGSFPSENSMAGLPAGLFRNLDAKKFAAVAEAAGIDDASLFSTGVAIADYDNDGFQDIFISGFGQPQLWRNMGDGTFQDAAKSAGIVDDRFETSAGWADFNGDGYVDLYLARYLNWSFQFNPLCTAPKYPDEREICPPRDYEPLPHSVYFNQGDGSFRDASAAAGLRDGGKGLGVLLCDVEPDGDMDIYVANDTVDNFLYVNDGGGNFEEAGIAADVARDSNGTPNGSMGVDLCDFNRDGRPDLWVANYERESFALYRNEGYNRFLHVSQRLGITDLGGLFVGFGTACEDFDSDGDVDLAVANGHVLKYPSGAPRKQLPLLLKYDGSRYQRMLSSQESYFGEPHEGRGLAVCDFDADGDLDIAILHLNDPLALLENEFHEHNRWLAVCLIGVWSNRDAVGTRVELQTNKGTWSRQITGGGSYLSHSSRSLHFPLPEEVEPQVLIVHWPSGRTQEFDASSLSGQVTLLEPKAEGESGRLDVRKGGQ